MRAQPHRLADFSHTVCHLETVQWHCAPVIDVLITLLFAARLKRDIVLAFQEMRWAPEKECAETDATTVIRSETWKQLCAQKTGQA
jgi:hypothetical protein